MAALAINDPVVKKVPLQMFHYMYILCKERREKSEVNPQFLKYTRIIARDFGKEVMKDLMDYITFRIESDKITENLREAERKAEREAALDELLNNIENMIQETETMLPQDDKLSKYGKSNLRF